MFSGDIRLTPFYDIDECLAKIKDCIDEINNGAVYTCDHMHVICSMFQCTEHV